MKTLYDPEPKFDAVKAIEARDKAIEQVDAHANAFWKTYALHAVKLVARRRLFLTTDAIWAVLDRMSVCPDDLEPRAMGAIMRRAVAEKLIRTTNQTRPSVRPACHARPVRVWRSLLHRDSAFPETPQEPDDSWGYLTS